MWSRKEIKTLSQARLHYNYWKMVVVGIIISLCGGSASSVFKWKFKSNTGFGHKEDSFHYFSFLPFPELDNVQNMIQSINLIHSSLIFLVIFGIMIAILFGIFVFNPLYAGCIRFFVKNVENNADFSEITFYFGKNYMNTVKTLFFWRLYIFLWTLLFIIPRIIKGYEYRMVPYILAERPDLDYKQVLQLSSRMMNYEKFHVFVLDLSFIGWGLLSLATCGIVGVFYVTPYIEQTYPFLYNILKCRVIDQLEQDVQPNQFT